MGSPRWALLGGQRCDRYCFAPPDRSYDAELRAFAEQAAIRYPSAAAIEAWNEPNLDFFWNSPLPGGPGPDPVRYTEVLRTIFEGVKSGNPDTVVLGGALSNAEYRGATPSWRLGDFLSAMYDNGARRWMDGLSFHPYPWGPRSGVPDLFHKTLDTVRATVAARDPGRRLWPDEMGAGISVADGDFTEAEQSAELLKHYRELDDAPDVDAVVFHALIDDNHWGWLKPRNDAGHVYPRPVFCAFVERFGALAEGETRNVATLPATKPKKKKKARKPKAKKRTKHKRAKKRTTKRKKRRAKPRALRMDCGKPLRFPS